MAWSRDFPLPPMSTLHSVLTRDRFSAPTHLQHAALKPPDHFMDLYSQHAASARALASRLLFDRVEAEDVVQDVFMTLWRRPERYDPDRGTGRAWLLTVVR